MRRTKIAPHAFTLVEMMVTISIFAIIMVVLGAMFLTLLQSYFSSDARIRLVDQTSTMTKRFTDVASGAFGIEASRTVGGTLYTSDATTIVFRIASIDGNGDAIATAFDYLIVTPNPGDATQLLEIMDADAASSRVDGTKLFGENIADAVIGYEEANPQESTVVYFSVTTEATVQSSTFMHTNHTHALLRNA